MRPRSRFVEDGVRFDAPADWGGESLEIENAGVSREGGLQISSSPESARVSAVARMLAIADTEDKPSADSAIDDSKKKLVDELLASAGKVVRCRHGATVASAQSADSGCDALDVSLPAGRVAKDATATEPARAAQPLSVIARSGNGNVSVSLHPDTLLAAFDLHATNGAIDFETPATTGATITVVAETGDDVVLRLPADFAADLIVLETTPDKIDTVDFPDVQSGKGRGVVGRGAKAITVRGGKIRLARR